MTQKILLPICVILITPLSLFAADNLNSGIIYGSEVALMVSAPEGWVFNDTSGLAMGINVMMYPIGSSMNNLTTMMYIRITEENIKPLYQFIEEDVQIFKNEKPKIIVQSADPISMNGGDTVYVKLFSGVRETDHECVAYIAKGKSVVLFVLTCTTQENFKKNLAIYRSMIRDSQLLEMKLIR